MNIKLKDVCVNQSNEIYNFIKNNEQCSLPIYSLIKNFKALVKTSPPNLVLKELAERIQYSSKEKINYYQNSRFGNLKKIFSIIRNFFTLGQWRSSGELGQELSSQYLKQIEEKLRKDIKNRIEKKDFKHLANEKKTGEYVSSLIVSEIEDYITSSKEDFEEDLKNCLTWFPLSSFSQKQQASIMNRAYKNEYGGYSGCFYYRDVNKVEVLQENLSLGLEKFPILEAYHSYSRGLNPTHLNLYGGSEVQETYHRHQKENVKYTLSVIKNKTLSFRELLETLGYRRRHTAMKVWDNQEVENRKDWQCFGLKRNFPISIPRGGAYTNYGQKLLDSNKIVISLNNKTYLLKETGTIPIFGDKPRPFNTYVNFWEEGDPIFAYAENLYNIITNQTFNDPQELKKNIATFHWLLSNCPIFNRGSASVLEVLTDAMWLSHGYLPQPIEAGKSLDLEALCTPKVEDFIKIYPMGIKPTHESRST